MVIIISPSVIGDWLYRLLGIIVIIGIVLTAFNYTFGNRSIGFWGICRFLGWITMIVSVIGIYTLVSSLRENGISPKEFFWDNNLHDERSWFVTYLAFFFFAILLIALGELLLYLHKLNKRTLSK